MGPQMSESRVRADSVEGGRGKDSGQIDKEQV